MTGHLREPSIPCDYNAFVHLAVPLPPPASSQRGCGAGWQRDRGGGDGGSRGQGGGDRRQKSGRVALRLRTGLQGPGEWRWRKPKTTFPISLDHPPRGRICTRRGTRPPPRTTGAQGLSAPGSCDTLRKCVPLPGRCPTPAPQKTERGRRGGRCGGWSPFPRRPSAAVSRAAGTQVTATHAHSRAYGQAAHSGDRWPFTNPVAIALKGARRGPQTGSKIPQATSQARKPAHHSLGSRCPVCLAAPPPHKPPPATTLLPTATWSPPTLVPDAGSTSPAPSLSQPRGQAGLPRASVPLPVAQGAFVLQVTNQWWEPDSQMATSQTKIESVASAPPPRGEKPGAAFLPGRRF